MSSVLVLGAGRSGTSLVAGLLVDAGLDPGDGLVPAGPANPTGYYERLAVNRLNDELIAPRLGESLVEVPGRLTWLAALPRVIDEEVGASTSRRMRALVPAGPFCLKDPRFVYTLPAWRNVLPADTRFVCVFRDPSRVAESVRRDAERDPAYYAGYSASANEVWRAWFCMMEHVLERHALRGRWHFVDADDLLATGDTSGLARVLGRPVPASRIDPRLARSTPRSRAPRAVLELYATLRRRARSG